jgi:hypothetical protein
MASYASFKRIATDSIVDAQVDVIDLADSAITAGKFATGAIASTKIANAAVGATELASTVDLSAKTVTYRSIGTNDIAPNAVSAGKLAAGATLSNVGYTPLSASGGTMTGRLVVPSGTAAAPAIQSAAQSNTGIYFDSANNVVFSVAGVERMRINASGHKTTGTDNTTGSIAWNAVPVGGWTYANSFGGNGWREIGGGFGGWDVQQRGGSDFNTSNGRFTAPVSGFYHLTWQGYHYNDDNNTPNYQHMSFSRNGSVGDWTGRTPHGMWMHGTVANHAGGVNQSLDLYLNASEYTACMVAWNGGPSRIHGTHSHFSGYLIG